MLEDEDKEGIERRDEASEEMEAEEEEGEFDEAEAIEAAAATAAALFSCRIEWEINAKSTVGGNGRVEGVDPPDTPRDKLVFVPLTSNLSPQASSSDLIFRFFILISPLLLLLLPMACTISGPPAAPNATPNNDGGRSDSESSGFCSLWRRKCTFRFPRVVKRLRHTGHW